MRKGAKTSLVVALVLTMGVAALTASLLPVKASGGDPSSAVFFMNGLGTPDGSNCGTASAPGLGSLDSVTPLTGDVGSPTSSGEFCTSAAGVYAGPPLAIISVRVTLYLWTLSASPVSLNSTFLNAEPSGTLLALSGYSSTPSWSSPSACQAESFNVTPLSGAQLSAGDLAASFFFVLQGSPAISESPQVCTGGDWLSFVNITGTALTSSSLSTTTTTVTTTSFTTLTSATTYTSVQTAATTIFDTITSTVTSTVTTGSGTLPTTAPFVFKLNSTNDDYELLNAALQGTPLPGARFIVQAQCTVGVGPVNFMVFSFTGAKIAKFSISGDMGTDRGKPGDVLILSFTSVAFQQKAATCGQGGTIHYDYYLDLTNAGIKGPYANYFLIYYFSWDGAVATSP
jgi:hypothetical protein